MPPWNSVSLAACPWSIVTTISVLSRTPSCRILAISEPSAWSQTISATLVSRRRRLVMPETAAIISARVRANPESGVLTVPLGVAVSANAVSES